MFRCCHGKCIMGEKLKKNWGSNSQIWPPNELNLTSTFGFQTTVQSFIKIEWELPPYRRGHCCRWVVATSIECSTYCIRQLVNYKLISVNLQIRNTRSMGNMATNAYTKSNYDRLRTEKVLGFWKFHNNENNKTTIPRMMFVSIRVPFRVQKYY